MLLRSVTESNLKSSLGEGHPPPETQSVEYRPVRLLGFSLRGGGMHPRCNALLCTSLSGPWPATFLLTAQCYVVQLELANQRGSVRGLSIHAPTVVFHARRRFSADETN